MKNILKFSFVPALVLLAMVSVMQSVKGDNLDCSNPRDILTAYILYDGQSGGGAVAMVSNNSDCTFDVDFKAIQTSNNAVFDSTSSIVGPQQTMQFHVNVPNCEYRLVLSTGSTVLASKTAGSGSCGGGSNPTPTPSKTPTPTPTITPPPSTSASLVVVKTVRNVTQNTAFSTSVNANPGDRVEFRVRTHSNYANATNVVLTDTLPNNFTFLGVTGSGTLMDSSPVKINLGSITRDTTKEIRIQTQVAAAGNFPVGSSTWVNNVTVDASNSSPKSDTASVVVIRTAPTPTPPIPTPTPTPTPPPASLSLTTNGQGIQTCPGTIQPVTLSWNSVSGATAYRVLRSGPQITAFQPIATVVGTTYSDFNVLPPQISYMVVALSGSNELATSNSVNAVWIIGDCPPPPVTPTPTPPSNCTMGTLIVNSNNDGVGYTISGPNGTLNANGNHIFTNQATGNYTINVTNSPNTVLVTPTTNILACNSTIIFNITTIVNNPTPTPTITPNPVIYGALNIAKTVRNITANSGEVETVNANQNETVEFVIRVSAVNAQTNNTRVTDSLPFGLSYVAGSTTVDNVSWQDGLTSGGLNLGSFYNGRQATIRFRATVNQSFSGSTTLTNSATAHADNIASVTDSASVMVTNVSQGQTLNIQKYGRNISRGDSANQTSLTARGGDTIEFTVTVTAPNNAALYNVVITDNLPAGLTYSQGSTSLNNVAIANGITSGGINIGTLNAGQTATVKFYATVNSGLTANQVLVNTASARADNVGTIQSNPVNITISPTILAKALKVRTGPADTAFALSGFGALMTTAIFYSRRRLSGSNLA